MKNIEDMSMGQLMRLATARYAIRCALQNLVYQEPSFALSEIDEDYVLLCDSDGPVAKFLIVDGALHYVEIRMTINDLLS